jgi:hypothetical protein
VEMDFSNDFFLNRKENLFKAGIKGNAKILISEKSFLKKIL